MIPRSSRQALYGFCATLIKPFFNLCHLYEKTFDMHLSLLQVFRGIGSLSPLVHVQRPRQRRASGRAALPVTPTPRGACLAF